MTIPNPNPNPTRTIVLLAGERNDSASAGLNLTLELVVRLSGGPVDRPADRLRRVNRPQRGAELKVMRHSVRKSSLYGIDRWVRNTASRLGLESTLRPRGRPKKKNIQEGAALIKELPRPVILVC